MSSFKYFSEADFERASPKCKLEDMDADFLEKLDVARFFAGVAFIVNSAFRTVAYELAHGRDGTSSHTKGIAIDIRARNSRERGRILAGLRRAGFHRIGIYQTFIHVDDDPEKEPNVTWLS